MAKQSWFARNKMWVIPLGIIVLLGLILIGWFVGSYNSLIYSRENVDTQFANLDAQYQRRYDLIPNLVEVVAGIAEQEREVFEQVTEARSRVGQINLDVSDLSDPAQMQAFQDAQAQFGSAIGRLLAVAENYPQLRSNENFLALQDQLEGTENRISVARRDYNEAVRTYNVLVQRIPTAIVANMFGFDTREFFEAQEGTQDAPQIDSGQFA